jgi:hypothetical protein
MIFLIVGILVVLLILYVYMYMSRTKLRSEELSAIVPVIATFSTYTPIDPILPDGKSYSKATLSSVQACSQNCIDDSSCDAFTFNDEEKVCAKFTGTKNKAFSAYWKGGSRTAFAKVPGMKLNANILRRAVAESEVDCAKACLGNDECNSFDYNETSKSCNLQKSKINGRVVSGVIPPRLSPIDLAKTS